MISRAGFPACAKNKSTGVSRGIGSQRLGARGGMRKRTIPAAWNGPYLGSGEGIDLFDGAIRHYLNWLDAAKKCFAHVP